MVRCFDDPYLIDRNFCIYNHIRIRPSSGYVSIRGPVFGFMETIKQYNIYIPGAIIPTSVV